MPRSGFARALAATLAALWLTAAAAQEDVEITVERVAEGIFMLQGQGGNVGLFTGEQTTFMIDDQFAPLTKKILTAIEEVGGRRPEFLLNTHYHADHTGGNENLGVAGTLIFAHEHVRERLAAGSYLALFEMKTLPQPPAALPAITFEDGLSWHINGETVRAFHVPHAHTDGDSVVHFVGANVIHAGDIFFNGFYPFIDTAHGGSLRGMIDGVDRVLELADGQTRIIPGHGPLGDRADLVAYREMLHTAWERLRRLKAEGKSAAEAVAEKPLADLEDTWGGGIMNGDRWVEVVYPGVY